MPVGEDWIGVVHAWHFLKHPVERADVDVHMPVQHEVHLQRAAASADAAGGVRALGTATDARMTELV